MDHGTACALDGAACMAVHTHDMAYQKAQHAHNMADYMFEPQSQHYVPLHNTHFMLHPLRVLIRRGQGYGPQTNDVAEYSSAAWPTTNGCIVFHCMDVAVQIKCSVMMHFFCLQQANPSKDGSSTAQIALGASLCCSSERSKVDHDMARTDMRVRPLCTASLSTHIFLFWTIRNLNRTMMQSNDSSCLMKAWDAPRKTK